MLQLEEADPEASQGCKEEEVKAVPAFVAVHF